SSAPSASGASGAPTPPRPSTDRRPCHCGEPAAGPARSPGDAPVRRPKGAAAKVIVRIDHAALVRGHARPGETCEIAGIGPVAVSTVREIIAVGDAFLAAVVTKGTDVCSVAHLGRQVTAHQRTALEWRDPRCSNIACTNTLALEIDHRTGWAATRDTCLDDLDRLCPSCHRLKTHGGYHLEPGSGRRRFLPPSAEHPHQLAITDGGVPDRPARRADPGRAASPCCSPG
ncbi:MAG: hypothetical protein JWM05_1465, partial [Acidimicrobiales bacterium]|nr:hypothetical protein [Acidimicrobiales bacterium]